MKLSGNIKGNIELNQKTHMYLGFYKRMYTVQSIRSNWFVFKSLFYCVYSFVYLCLSHSFSVFISIVCLAKITSFPRV